MFVSGMQDVKRSKWALWRCPDMPEGPNLVSASRYNPIAA